MARIHRKLYKKELHDQDNHDGVITHLEPDILECEAQWALESITRNKVVEVMEFQLSYSKSWKMMLEYCCTQYASKFGQLSSGHRTGKGQCSFQSQRKAMPKNAQTTCYLVQVNIRLVGELLLLLIMIRLLEATADLTQPFGIVAWLY